MALRRVSARPPPRSILPIEDARFRCARALSTSPFAYSGHSKWSKIKHDKAQNDSRKGKQRSILVRDISLASKQLGPDPSKNEQLASVIAKAKQSGMQKSVIEAAVLRGQGKSTTGARLEPVTVEAVVPPVALIIEGETDKKTQLLSELRVILKSHGGTVTPTTYMFQRTGRIAFAHRDDVSDEDVLLLALEEGAMDVSVQDDGVIIVDTKPTALKAVESALSGNFGLSAIESETLWVPNADTAVASLDEAATADLDQLLGKLEEYPGVEEVYTNFTDVRV